MSNIWHKSGDTYSLASDSRNVKNLENKIYKLDFNVMTGEHYLTEVQDKYEFPYKIYGMETDFIDRVLKTFKNTKANLGLLLNGVKGTGKTVTAKIIANNLEIPVILIHKFTFGTVNFLNSIQQEITIFIDEYEKIFDEKDGSILTLMDGVLDNGYRKVFLLTTNNLFVNQNLLQRPGRIRYLKTYNDLTLPYITEIVEDKLNYPELKDSCIKFISKLKTITVDIIKAIVDEVNIHAEDPAKFADVFNVAMNNATYNIYKINNKDPEKSELLIPHAYIGNTYQKNVEFELGEFEEYDNLYINSRAMGTITNIDDNIIEVDPGNNKKIKYKLEANSPLHLSFMIS